MNGEEAVVLLNAMTDKVELIKRDNSDKFWCYKLKYGSRAEFAFDPNTKTKLIVRFDRAIPEIDGVSSTESLKGKNISTALERVFSGGKNTAKFKSNIETHGALKAVIEHLAQQ
jgi:hypothetical protein